MSSEKLLDAMGGISDRFIDEYNAAMRPGAIKKRRLWRAVRIAAPIAACLCLTFLIYPLSVLLFGGSQSGDPYWDGCHEYIPTDECADLLVGRLPTPAASEAYLFFDEGGRHDRAKWNSLQYTAVYEGEGVFDLVSVEMYFENDSVLSGADADRYKGEGSAYHPYKKSGERISINGVSVEYSDLSADPGYSGGYLEHVYTDAEFDALGDTLYETYSRDGRTEEEAALSVARYKSSYCRCYTTGFEYDGVLYVVTVYSRYNDAPILYYLGLMIPEVE